jgi:hypothetical protein
LYGGGNQCTKELKKIDETENHSVPKHFFCGPRKLNIILTQLRNSASFLNFDLLKESLVEDSLQKGRISFPFLNGYTDVRCMVGGINVQR